jgi:hypothetical protein
MSASILLGIRVARAMVAGDVEGARRLAHPRRSWSVPELRAILGAGRHIERVFGAPKGIARSVLGWAS